MDEWKDVEKLEKEIFPLISVIIPVYNVEKYLERCISSLTRQTYRNIEIILIDDGSTDGSARICDEFESKNKNVKVIHQPNMGVSIARNKGIALSKGDLISFVDADDYVTEEYLEYLFSLFTSEKDISFSECNYYVQRNGKNKPAFPIDESFVMTPQQAFHSVMYHGAVDVSPCAKLYRKDLFQAVRYPEGRIYEDTYIFGVILNASEKIIVGGLPHYYYVQHENSIVNGGFDSSRFMYIEAVENLINEAEKCCDSELEAACERRLCHAYLSVLRYMSSCPKEFRNKRDEIRSLVLKKARQLLRNVEAPRRDKIAVIVLAMGYKPFYLLWKIYNYIR